jgi:mono/diheme cytochrome c family protein
MPALSLNTSACWRALIALLVATVGVSVAAAPKRDADQATRGAMRILRDECISCHGAEKQKGGLSFATREDALKGGDEGPVLAPGKPAESRLLSALAAEADPHMPPKRQLETAQISTLRDWVKRGAKWDAVTLAGEAEEMAPVALSDLPTGYQPANALSLSSDATRALAVRGNRVLGLQVTTTNLAVAWTVTNQVDAVQSLAWAPGGSQFAAGSFREIRLRSAVDGALVRSLTNRLNGRVTVLVFASDGASLLAADSLPARKGIVRVFDPATGEQRAEWTAHADTIYALALSPDGERVATAGGDRLIKLWDWKSQKELARFEGHNGAVLGIAFNTNGTQLVSGGADKELKVWDVATREKLIALKTHQAGFNAVAWSTDGQQIFAAAEDGAIFRFTDLKTHTGAQSSETAQERQLAKVGETLLSLGISADGGIVLAGSHEGRIQAWNRDGKSIGESVGELPAVTLAKPAPSPSTAKQGRSASRPEISPVRLERKAVKAVQVWPEAVTLRTRDFGQGLLVTAQLHDGFEVDATGTAEFRADRSGVFAVDEVGLVKPLKPGQGELTIRAARQTVKVPVTVTAAVGAGEPVSFVSDVLPVLSKAGCNSGGCHAKPEGQNGFKLSVFSYDPRADHAEIVKEARGRRVFPAAPTESLLLLKPTQGVPHEGGKRFEVGSEPHQLLVRWLREGMTYQVPDEPKLERLTVYPRERRYRKKARQQLRVQAHYSDGSVRDVTRLAGFAANDKELVQVTEAGALTVGKLTGQAVIVARYMGLVADAKVVVPAERLLPAERYASLPRSNFIDDLAYAHFQQLGLLPSAPSTDAEFLRRASLDTVGVLPSAAEVRAFLGMKEGMDDAATRPKADRQALIERLLDDPAYADYWANKFADLLRPNPDRVGVKSIFTLDQWLRESFRANKPYDQFVREIVTAEGSNHRDGPAVIYRDRREPAELTTMFSQLFLGTRLECAKCHHHPNEKWSQDDFYQFAAYFGPLKQKGAGLSPPISAGTETFYFAPGGTVKHPVTGEVMAPRPPDGDQPQVAGDADPRRALADWLTSPENPFFARAAVNRVWANFFGRGLVDPVDDFRISNPCVNQALLDALAADFAKHGYDLKHLIRTILSSQLYQLSSEPNETNLTDTKNFSRSYRRRLPAEVLLDAVNDITGVPDTFAAMPASTRAMQMWSYKIDSPLLDAFGRPNSSSDCPCERDLRTSVVQSLHLMNSKTLQQKLSSADGLVARLVKSERPITELVTEMYLATYNRPPTTAELAKATAAYSAPEATRQTATEDVLWALLNSAEFVFNH